MAKLIVAHTADLDRDSLDAARALLWNAFDDMGEDDWEHSLGGVHALLWDGSELIGHGAVVQRRMLHGGRALRTGYVEGMAVRPDRQRRGHGGVIMDALERVIRQAYDLGALGASDAGVPLYTTRGWRPWRGQLSTITPTGVRPTPEECGCVYVMATAAPLDLDRELTCDWRDGDVW